MKKESITTPPTNKGIDDRSKLPLARCNFVAMGFAGVLIIFGFVLMLGAGSTIDQFNPDIFSTRRIVVGPIISFIGFVIMAVAIIIGNRKIIGDSNNKLQSNNGND